MDSNPTRSVDGTPCVVWSSLSDADKDALIANLVDTIDEYEEMFARMRLAMTTAAVALGFPGPGDKAALRVA